MKLKNMNSMQTVAEDIPQVELLVSPLRPKPIEIHIQQLELSLAWAVFVFCHNNCLVHVQISSYLESTVTAPIFSIVYIKLYFSPWPADVMIETVGTDSISKSTHSQHFPVKTNLDVFMQVSKMSPCFCYLEAILQQNCK